MINLTYNGHSCFTLDFDGYTIVVDPFTGVPGYKELKLTANEVLCSHGHGDHNYVKAVDVIGGDRPAGLEVVEISSFHDPEGGKLRGSNILRIFKYNGLSVMHCGDIGCIPTEEQLLLMKNLDCVLIPVGGYYTMEPKECKKFLSLIKPKLVIPMHYRTDKTGYGEIGTVDDFTDLMGSSKELKNSALELTGKETGICILQAK